MILNIFTLFFSCYFLLLLSQQCSQDGVCVAQDDVVIPKYANKEGKPIEASENCIDRHEHCQEFVQQGEC